MSLRFSLTLWAKVRVSRTFTLSTSLSASFSKKMRTMNVAPFLSHTMGQGSCLTNLHAVNIHIYQVFEESEDDECRSVSLSHYGPRFVSHEPSRCQHPYLPGFRRK